MTNIWRLSFLACLFVPCLAWAGAAQPIETFHLKNGMEVVVLPNHRIPAVNHMIWYRVGAADDPQGKSGLAHFHEHLMFKGSPKFASGVFVETINRNGGEHNAFTGHDATSYYVTIAKDRLPLVMELEADRMRALVVSDDEAVKEKQVILEERRSRTDNVPEAQLDEQMDAALFRNHPYHTPVIGWLHEMEQLTKRDVLEFHRKYYHPNNVVLVVSGDITAAELKPLAEKYYGNLPHAPIPKRLWMQEPPQLAARHLTLHHENVRQPIFKRIYEAPSTLHGNGTQAMPLMVLAHALGGGKNSVLYQSLVAEQKLATDVDVSYNFYARGPATFSIQIVPEQNLSLPVLEAALDKLLAHVLSSGVAPEIVTRSKKLLQAESIYSREKLTGISNIIGWMVMAEMPPEHFNRWSEMVEQVRAEQLAVAAKAVLRPDASVTGYLLPREAE